MLRIRSAIYDAPAGRWLRPLPLRRCARIVTNASASGSQDGATPRIGTLARSLSPMLSPLSDFDDDNTTSALRSEPAVWGAATIAEAWDSLNQALGSASRGCKASSSLLGDTTDTNSGDAAGFATSDLDRLLSMDLRALAAISARAELQRLLECLSPELRRALLSHPGFDRDRIEELYVHVGQPVEMRCDTEVVTLPAPSVDDIRCITRAVGSIGTDGRGCVLGTLHRVSVWRGRDGQPLGYTLRVGKYVPNVARALVPLAERGSLLLLSKPGVGKTTVLRDLAATLARGRGGNHPRVVIIDTSNEIGGDGNHPMPYLGRARRLQVPFRSAQADLMNQALANHTPEYIIVDEVGSDAEAQAVLTMTQRGVKVVATAHGESLSKLLQNRALNNTVGGVAQAFLSSDERRIRGKVKKTVLERPYESPFQYVVELRGREMGRLFHRVDETVDALLDDLSPETDPQMCRSLVLTEPLDVSTLSRWTAKSATGSAATGSLVSNAVGAAAYAAAVSTEGNQHQRHHHQQQLQNRRPHHQQHHQQHRPQQQQQQQHVSQAQPRRESSPMNDFKDPIDAMLDSFGQ